MPNPRDNTLLDAAVHYSRTYGWCIVPANAKSKSVALSSWTKYQTTRPSEEQIIKWFSSGCYDALGVIAGGVSGDLVILDFDRQQMCDWWDANHADKHLPMERTVRGRHVFMRWPNCITQKREKEGVELRSIAAMTVISPSPGKHWLIDPNGEIPELNPFALGLEVFGICEKISPVLENPDSQEFTEEKEEEISSAFFCLRLASSVKCQDGASSVKLSAVDEKTQREVEDAIVSTLPEGPRQRNRAIFRLCQAIKGIAALRDCPAAHLRGIVQEWYERALPVIRTKNFDESWADFTYGWPRVKWPRGLVLGLALTKALDDTTNPAQASIYSDPRNQLLVRVCWQLQRICGDAPFFLSCRNAGRIMEVSHTEASKRLEMLIADGILEIAERYTTNKATRYHFKEWNDGTIT